MSALAIIPCVILVGAERRARAAAADEIGTLEASAVGEPVPA
jgi:hypothetical protein